MRHIGKLAGVKRYAGTERDWAIICSAGLPYTMLFRLIQEYLVYTVCNSGFLGTELFEKHKKIQTDKDTMPHISEFDWVMIHTSDGHYEMNLMKAFVELNWDDFMTVLVRRMSWTSDSAMKAAKQCYDNHKTWHLLNHKTWQLLLVITV